MKNGVAIYGGFNGTETLLSQRNWVNNISKLSGELGVTGIYDNSKIVIHAGGGVTNSATLDGFTVSGGYQDDESGRGGGLYLNGGAAPIVANCIFSGNSGNYIAGGIVNEGANPTIKNCMFVGNSTTGIYGGGLISFFNATSQVINCAFHSNVAPWGGGLANIFSSTSTIVNCSFNNNTGVYQGGGIYNLYNSPTTVTNSIIWGNSPAISNLDNANTVISYSIVQSNYPGTGNLNADPLFFNSAGGNLPVRLDRRRGVECGKSDRLSTIFERIHLFRPKHLLQPGTFNLERSCPHRRKHPIHLPMAEIHQQRQLYRHLRCNEPQP
jgi:hypothetical protein